MAFRWLALLAPGALGLSCNLAPTYQRPASPVPASFPANADGARAHTDAKPLPLVRYQDVFRDPKLQAVLSEALTNSRDLRVAAANVLSARALYRVQRAGLFPRVDANAGVVVGGGATSSGAVASNGPGDLYQVYSANLGLTSFELDLFGRVRNSTEAALNAYLASEAGARAARFALVSQVAATYFSLAADNSRLGIAKDTVENANASAAIARARLSGGVSARLDLSQADTIVAQARASIAEQTTAVAQDVNALELLVGAPVAKNMLPSSLEQVAESLAALPAGLSSEVLLRRPDVVEAEYLLKAAGARIGAARAAFFPTISLTGLLGFASTSLRTLFSSESFGWNVHPNAGVNIFNGGADAANLDYAWAQRDLYLAQYERAIQTAFREVADALAREQTIAEQLAATRALVDAATVSYQLAEARYRGGVESFLTSLEAQRTLFSARQSLVAVRLLEAQMRIGLYRALGGDSFLASR